MRNGGYRGIADPTIVSDTHGIHTTRDAFEKSKEFDGSFHTSIVAATVNIDSTPTGSGNNLVTINSVDTTTGEFDVELLDPATRLWSTRLPLGKYYYEIKMISVSQPYTMFCPISHESASYAQTYNLPGQNMWYASSGNKFPGNVASGLGSFNAVPEILRCAYDTATGKCWFGANNLWSSNTGNPGSGGAGLTIYGWGTYGNILAYRALIGQGSGTDYNFQGQFLTGNNLTNSPPSGFTAL